MHATDETRSPGVLVTGDEPSLLRQLVRSLEALGVAVWGAPSGDEAVEVLRLHRRRIDAALRAHSASAVSALKRGKLGLPCCVVAGPDGSLAAAVADCVLAGVLAPAHLAACVRGLLGQAP